MVPRILGHSHVVGLHKREDLASAHAGTDGPDPSSWCLQRLWLRLSRSLPYVRGVPSTSEARDFRVQLKVWGFVLSLLGVYAGVPGFRAEHVPIWEFICSGFLFPSVFRRTSVLELDIPKTLPLMIEASIPCAGSSA